MKNRLVVAWCLLAPLAVAGSCAKIQEKDEPGAGTGGRSGGGSGGSGGRPAVMPPSPCPNNVCADFPADPITSDPDDPGLPSNPGGMFNGAPPAPNGLCISEPETDTLFPNNWLRPRVKFANPNHEVAQIRMRAANQTNELVAYTSSDTWKLPRDIWDKVRGHQISDDVIVTVWLKSGMVGQTKFRTAPVGAAGKMVFWAARPSEVGKDLNKLSPPYTTQMDPRLDMDSELRGFAVGDEGTVSVLKVSQVQQLSRDNNSMRAPVRCIGCHVATPDGGHVAFNDSWPWRMAIASVQGAGQSGALMPEVTTGGMQNLIQNGLGISTFSKAYWSTTTGYLLVTSYGKTCAPDSTDGTCLYTDAATKNPMPKLAWFDMQAPAAPWEDPANMRNPKLVLGTNMGFITRTNDPRGAASPTWSHDGQTIVYSSTAGALDGRLERGETDLWQVPFNNKAGGVATPLQGGNLANRWEYYPAFSPDDKLIAFTSVPAGERMYANPNAEVFVVSAGGQAQPTKLNANTPPSCTGKASPGINNHWPRWSPAAVKSTNGYTYYWLIFSSNRSEIPAGTPACSPTPCYDGYVKAPVPVSQLYMTGVLVGESGTVEVNTPAIYLWNQPTDTLNTTPAWEDFKIPMVD